MFAPIWILALFHKKVQKQQTVNEGQKEENSHEKWIMTVLGERNPDFRDKNKRIDM